MCNGSNVILMVILIMANIIIMKSNGVMIILMK